MQSEEELFARTQERITSCIDILQKSLLAMQAFPEQEISAETFNVNAGFLFEPDILFASVPYVLSVNLVFCLSLIQFLDDTAFIRNIQIHHD